MSDRIWLLLKRASNTLDRISLTDIQGTRQGDQHETRKMFLLCVLVNLTTKYKFIYLSLQEKKQS